MLDQMNYKKAIETGIVNGSYIGFDKFGMPSCHSQNCGFYLSFITLTLNDPYITTLYASYFYYDYFTKIFLRTQFYFTTNYWIITWNLAWIFNTRNFNTIYCWQYRY